MLSAGPPAGVREPPVSASPQRGRITESAKAATQGTDLPPVVAVGTAA